MADDKGAGGATEATGIDGAATAIEAILTAQERGTREKPRESKSAAKQAEAPQAEAQPSDDADETADDLDEDEDDDAEKEDPADDAAQPEVDPKSFKVTVRVDGKTEDITLEEAVNGYQRGRDYARKTEAISHERREIAAERDALRAERQQYAQLLPALSEQLKAQEQAQAIDWDALYRDDPVEWVRQREIARDRVDRFKAAQAEAQRVTAQMEAETATEMGSHIAAERDLLLEAIPTWKDKARWDRDRIALREYGKKLGFTDEELSMAYDHRAVVALYKAMRYERITSAKPPRPETAASAAPAPRAVPRSSTPKPVSAATRDRMRLAKTGKMQDFAKVLEGLI
jgi:hypothetical protein